MKLLKIFETDDSDHEINLTMKEVNGKFKSYFPVVIEYNDETTEKLLKSLDHVQIFRFNNDVEIEGDHGVVNKPLSHIFLWNDDSDIILGFLDIYGNMQILYDYNKVITFTDRVEVKTLYELNLNYKRISTIFNYLRYSYEELIKGYINYLELQFEIYDVSELTKRNFIKDISNLSSSEQMFLITNSDKMILKKLHNKHNLNIPYDVIVFSSYADKNNNEQMKNIEAINKQENSSIYVDGEELEEYCRNSIFKNEDDNVRLNNKEKAELINSLDYNSLQVIEKIIDEIV